MYSVCLQEKNINWNSINIPNIDSKDWMSNKFENLLKLLETLEDIPGDTRNWNFFIQFHFLTLSTNILKTYIDQFQSKKSHEGMQTKLKTLSLVICGPQSTTMHKTERHMQFIIIHRKHIIHKWKIYLNVCH